MSYRTILVHLDPAAGMAGRVSFAARLAEQHGAHLIGVTETGAASFAYGPVVPTLDPAGLAPLLARLHDDARRRVHQFDEIAGRAGLASFEHRIADEDPDTTLSAQTLYADLAIVAQTSPDDTSGMLAGIPEFVTLSSPCPVLVLPHVRSAHEPEFARILIGWNASVEAARALRGALPLLERASEVEVAVCTEQNTPQATLDGEDAALFLARHGVKVSLWTCQAGGDTADALLARAEQTRADLLVMGCYGHSRLREILLGGVSRTVLRRMRVPTLMAH